jgi:hypothetical protein
MDNTNRRFLDTYLSSPIIRNERDRVFPLIVAWRAGSKMKPVVRGDKSIRALATWEGGLELKVMDPEHYQTVADEFEVEDHHEEIERALALTTSLMKMTDAGLSEWGLRPARSCESGVPNICAGYLIRQYNLMRFFEGFLNKLSCSRAGGGKGLVEYDTPYVALRGNEYVCLVADRVKKTIYLVAHAQVLMLKDMFYGRFNTLLGASVLYPGEDTQILLKTCFTWALNCLSSYGNAGYGIVKTIEQLAKTNLIRKVDDVFGLDGPHQIMIGICQRKEEAMADGVSPHIDALEQLLVQVRDRQIDVEIFGLQKLSGHPLVDPTLGGIKVRETARKRITYRPYHIRRLRNNFCRMYLEGYVRRESSWPPLVYEETALGTKLYSLMIRNELHLHNRSYDLMEWDHFRFREHRVFDYYPNFTDLMDDKSISLYRDNLMATWDAGITPRSNKRLLLEMLSKPSITIKDIVDRVRVGEIPFEWLIVSLYPKEREFKDPPRMYGMMVFEMRAFFTCTEANIADHIFPFLPPQTMTLSKIEIQSLFQEATKGSWNQDMHKLYGEFDLEGWNGHFHDELVDPIAIDLEDMFGLPGVYTVIHHFFKDSVMSVRVKECPPAHGHEAMHPGQFSRELEDGVLWPDHDAGIEGLAQKVWSCPTYSMFDLAMQQFNLKYYTIGQADNQIYIASVPGSLIRETTGGLKTIALQIAKAAEEECAHAGHTLNLDECLYSRVLVSYSKDLWIEGSEYYTSLKAVSRVFPHSASDFPSVVNSVGAVSGQMLSAAEKMKFPLMGYVLCALHTTLYLSTLHRRLPVETSQLTRGFPSQMTDSTILAMSAYPGELGGLPIGHILGFIYKGGSDPLGKACGSLKLLGTRSPLMRRVAHCLHSWKWMTPKPDVTRLIDDPYSLPLARTQTPEMSILRQSISKVREMAKNHAIRELMDLVIGGYEEEFREALTTCRPLNPVLLSDIYGWSVLGVTRTTLKMFTSTQTIQALLQRDEELNPCSQILVVGASQVSNLLRRLHRMRDEEYRITSCFDYTQHLRLSWFPETKEMLVGVTTYSVVDFPISYSEPQHTLNGFKVHVRAAMTQDPHNVRGPETVYFGRPTREKRSEWGYRIITESGPERAVEKLSRLIVQPGIGPRLKLLIAHASDTRGDFDLLGESRLLGAVYGGTTDHRLESRFGHLSANILGVTVFASHCVLSTDTAFPFSGGGEDRPLMVQEPMVGMIGCAAISYPFPGHSSSLTMVVPPREYQVIEAQEMETATRTIRNPPILRGNVMAYAQEIHLQRSIARHDLPLVGVVGVRDSDPTLPYAGVTNLVYRGITKSHQATAVADRGAGRIHLNLDLAEIRGLGASVVLQAASLAIARVSIDALFSRSEEGFRWTPVPVMMSISQSLSGSLASYIKHPLIQEQGWVQRNLRHSGLTYSEGRARLENKITQHLVQGALRMFNDPGSILYRAPLLLFLDEADGGVWLSAAHVIKRGALESVIRGELTLTQAYQLVRRNLTVAIMGRTAERDRVTRISDFALNIASWADREGHTSFAQNLKELHSGRKVKMVQTSAAQAFRLARKMSPPVFLEGPPDSDLPVLSMAEHLQVPTESTTEEHPSLSGGAWRGVFDDRAWACFSAQRLQGRVYGGDSSAGYSYLPIVSWISRRPFFLVGTGHGGGAAALLLGGAERCYGVDLSSDLEEHSLMNGAPVPSSIALAGCSERFTRVYPGSGWDGDIRDPLAAGQVKRWLGTGCVWVIDIPLKEPTDVARSLWTMSECIPTGYFQWRIMGEREKARDIAGFLRANTVSLAWTPVYISEVYVEGWLGGQLSGDVIQAGSPQIAMPFGSTFPHWEVDCSALGGGKEYLLTLCTMGLFTFGNQELEAACLQMERMVGASVGELEHRFTYRQWTQVMEALICIKILQSPHPMTLLTSIVNHEQLTFRVVQTIARKHVDRGLIRLLTRLLARAL